MTDKQTQEQATKGNMLKDPDQWTTGEGPMTGAQRSYLKTLSEDRYYQDLCSCRARHEQQSGW